KNNQTATLYSASAAKSTINLISEGRPDFHISIIGEKGRLDRVIERDENPYLSGIKEFCSMFRTGKTVETDVTILNPIATLEALEKSIKTGKKVKLPSIR
ncbi:MAG: hypothetical protein ACO36I_26100, partial [Candidatus Latescibacterota bacterium]